MQTQHTLLGCTGTGYEAVTGTDPERFSADALTTAGTNPGEDSPDVGAAGSPTAHATQPETGARLGGPVSPLSSRDDSWLEPAGCGTSPAQHHHEAGSPSRHGLPTSPDSQASDPRRIDCASTEGDSPARSVRGGGSSMAPAGSAAAT